MRDTWISYPLLTSLLIPANALQMLHWEAAEGETRALEAFLSSYLKTLMKGGGQFRAVAACSSLQLNSTL